MHKIYVGIHIMGFPCGSAGKESTCNAGDLGSIPGLGRFPGKGRGYPLQYSGLENSRDYTVYGVAKSRTRLSNFHCHLYFLGCPVHLTPTHINFVKLYIMKIFAREKNIINPQIPIFQLQQWRHLQSLLRKLSKKTSPACAPLTAGSGNVCATSSWKPVMLPHKPCPRACRRALVPLVLCSFHPASHHSVTTGHNKHLLMPHTCWAPVLCQSLTRAAASSRRCWPK